MNLSSSPESGLLRRWTISQRVALGALVVFLIGFGGLVEVRGALLRGRHTDAGTYFRAAWAVREGANPYLMVDENGWHYTYPPLLASVMTLLADAPRGYSRSGLLPYADSIGIWYLLNVGFMVGGIWVLADALVRTVARSARRPVDEEHRWALLFWPFFLCLPVFCRSAIRGQVGPIWLAGCCMVVAAVIQRRPVRAGLWLALVICLKLIPLYLLIYPLWRRDWRMLGACAAGLIVGVVVIPAVAMGPEGMIQGYRQYVHSTVLPAAAGGRIDRSVEHELVDPRTSDTQSFRSVLMNIGHMLANTPRTYDPPLFARIGHWTLAALLTGGLLFASGWRAPTDPLDDALLLSMLMVLMLPIAPVCHPHYLLLMLPLIAVLLARWMRPGEPSRQGIAWTGLLLLIPASHILTSLPNADPFRDSGTVIWGAIAVVIAAARLLNTRPADESAQPPIVAGSSAMA